MEQPALSDFIWVDQDKDLAPVWDDLARYDVFALDTESNSFHGYISKICLLQLATPSQVTLIDVLAVSPQSLLPLGEYLANSEVTKVMHGSDNDILGLQRDFNFRVKRLFDTVLAARYLNLPKRGLDHLLKQYCGVQTSKQFQRFDWTQRPLPMDALRYAAGDAFYLLEMFGLMTQQLRAQKRLEHVLEDSQLLASRTYEEKLFDPDGFWRIKGIQSLSPKQQAVLQALYLWRHDVCMELNMAAFLVLDERTMLSLARLQPTTPQQLFRVRNANRSQIRRHCQELVEVIEEGSETHPPQRKVKRKRKSNKPPVQERVFEALKQWRQTAAERDNFEVDLIATKQMLLNIARSCPRELSGLSEIPNMTPWRLAQYGEDWLKLIEQNDRR